MARTLGYSEGTVLGLADIYRAKIKFYARHIKLLEFVELKDGAHVRAVGLKKTLSASPRLRTLKCT